MCLEARDYNVKIAFYKQTLEVVNSVQAPVNSSRGQRLFAPHQQDGRVVTSALPPPPVGRDTTQHWDRSSMHYKILFMASFVPCRRQVNNFQTTTNGRRHPSGDVIVTHASGTLPSLYIQDGWHVEQRIKKEMNISRTIRLSSLSLLIKCL